MTKEKIAVEEVQATSHADDSAEVAELKAQIEEAENRLLAAGLTAEVSPEMDALVKQKMRAGLSREDAIVCARRQSKSAAITVERDALIKQVTADVNKKWEGKDRRQPEYKQELADTISSAVAAGKFHERFVAAGSLQLNPA